MPWKPLIHSKQESEGHERFFARAKRTKFLVDENLGKGLAELLKDGWKANAEYAPDVGLGGRSDEEVIAYAWKSGRILLTHDRGFLDDQRFPEHRNPGVVVLPGGSGDENALVSALQCMMSTVDRGPEVWLKTKVIVSPDGEITVKKRHADSGRIETTRFRLTRGSGPPLIWKD